MLDLDRSVGPIPGAQRIALADWQERLRFACTSATLRRFAGALESLLPASHGTVMLGSGDFHHLSWPLIQRAPARTPFQVVVLDNHPDNMRFPFGVHCGSWVRRVASLRQVTHVHVLGVSSTDVCAGHAWELYLAPLWRRRVTFWCIGVDVGWAARLGLAHAFRGFSSADELVRAFGDQQRGCRGPTYLSIDKDVFAEDVVRTNWDQGRLRLAQAEALIEALPGALVGSDITGEVSHYDYASFWKRRLAARDAQPPVAASALAAWQVQQHALNLELLRAIAARTV